MKRLLTTLLALALVAAACGDDGEADSGDDTDAGATTTLDTTDPAGDDDGDDGAASSTTGAPDEPEEPEPVELFDSYQGVTATDITIGVAAIDTEALLAFDVDLGVAPVEQLLDAWVAAQNERGGVLGRDLVVHTRLFLPIGSVPAEEICLEFAQDIGVFAVIGQFLGDNPLCVTELEGLPYVGHFGLTTERDERSEGRFIATEMSQELQRYGSVTEMLAQGDLDGQRVALWWDAPADSVFRDLVRPLLDEAGIEVTAEVEVGDFGQDTAAAEAAADPLMQRIIAEETDVIIGLSGILPVTEAADRNGFEGTIAFTNGQAADQFIFPEAVASDEVKANTFAITTDKPTPEEALADPDVEQCKAEYDEAFPDAPLDLESKTDIAALTNHCRAFRLLVLVLETAGADLNPESFVAAADSLGEFRLPAMDASLSPEKRAAGSKIRRYEYDAAEGFHLPVGEPIDPAPLP